MNTVVAIQRVVALAALGLGLGAGSLHAVPAIGDSSLRVMNYLSLEQESNLVVVSAGENEGIVSGTVFRVYRPVTPKKRTVSVADVMFVETGVLKAVDVQKHRTIAMITGTGSDMSRVFFPKFPGVMAGDTVVVQRLSLTRRPSIMPEITLSYRVLFEDPKATPSSFELNEAGRAKLREEAAVYANARVSLLMVEGYTDGSGPADVNQVESYQRALTVRQFLIDEMGFDEERVVAVGYGESELADQSLAPGSRDRNRRVVLKVVPVAE